MKPIFDEITSADITSFITPLSRLTIKSEKANKKDLLTQDQECESSY